MLFLQLGLWLILVTLVSGCVYQERNVQISSANFRSDYGYRGTSNLGQNLPRHHVVMTFSGGGTRAAALAEGVLRELAATPIADGRTMADEIDVISSVSGGSVTAANFALHGASGFAEYEENFLRRNVMTDLVGGVLNPLNIARFSATRHSRVDLLVDVLDQTVFHEATFADLIKRDRRPFLILNSADMSSGARFTFTQSQFDLLCSDLSSFRIANAVAASAAFPVALTPITLRNYSPCHAQKDNPDLISRVESGIGDNVHNDPEDRPDQVKRMQSDTLYISPSGATIERRFAAMRERQWLNADGRKSFVHLLDGGIADNLGLGELLELVSAAGQDGSISRAANNEEIKEIVFIVVNARSDPTTARDRSGSSPGVLSMGLASVGAAIDGRSSGLQAQLSNLEELSSRLGLRVRIIPVDFDRIRTDDCRITFGNIDTNWNLDDHVVYSLMELGAAMIRSSPDYQEVVAAAGGQVTSDWVAEGNDWPGQARAKRACARLMSPKIDPGPVIFGNSAIWAERIYQLSY